MANFIRRGLGAAWSGVAVPFWKGAVMPAAEKVIPQGAAELAQALFTGTAYVPYGPTEKDMEAAEAGQTLARHGVEHTTEERLEGAAAWFNAQANLERKVNVTRTPMQVEQSLDNWQELAGQVRQAAEVNNQVPPLWSVMNREEMAQAFSPEPKVSRFEQAIQQAQMSGPEPEQEIEL